MNLTVIEQLAKHYSESREILSSLVTDLNEKLERIKRHHMPAIRRAVQAAAGHHNSLNSALEEYPELFAKPKTQIFHGIRVGYVKGKGRTHISNAEQTIKLIEKHLPKLLDTLAPAERSISKTALKNLTVEQLKSIGCSITDAGEHILIEPVDDAVDKLVSALLKDATEDPAIKEAA